MQQMINSYRQSSEKAKARINELTELKNELNKQGRDELIERLDLKRRIRLLYIENSQLEETIECLTSCMRRIEERVEKRELL